MKTFYFSLFILLAFIGKAQEKKDSCCHLLDSIDKVTKQETACCCEEDTSIKCYNVKTHHYINTQTVLYDFKTKNIAFPNGDKYLKRGDAIKVKLVNFNPFIYKAVINYTDSSYKAAVDAGNLLSAFGSIDKIPNLISGIANAIITSPVANSSQKKAVSALIGSLKLKGTIGAELLQTIEDSVMQGTSNQLETNKANEDNVMELFGDQNDIIQEYTQRLFDEKSSIDRTIYNWSTLFSPERNPFPSCSEFSNLTSGANKRMLLDEFDSIKNSIKEFLNNVSDDQAEYLFESSFFNEVINNPKNKPLKAVDDLIKSFYTQLSAQVFKVDSLMSYQSLQQLMESLDKIKDLKLCYTSAPIFLNGDSKIVTLQIKPWKDTMPYQTDTPITFELPWQQKHIWGINAGIYGSGLHNDHYSTLVNVNGIDTTYDLKKDNTGNSEFGINALAYTGWKKSDNFYIGASFGAGLSIESKPKPRIFLGGSLIYGNKNRILFSVGAIAGFVDRLSSVYQNNMNQLHVNPVSNTNSVMKTNFFVSINYSFINN